MNSQYIEQYQMITRSSAPQEREYKGPEEQGRSIEICTLLKRTNIEYSNETKYRPKS